ncbi:MAG: hypothetical protein WC390_07270 [Sulfurimonas sp.]|jgi:hypothetical protein
MENKDFENILKNFEELKLNLYKNLSDNEKKLNNYKTKNKKELVLKQFLNNTIKDIRENKQIDLSGFLNKIKEINANSNNTHK